MINAIVTIDSEYGISKNGEIPWNIIREDMQRFKHLTLGGIVIMEHDRWLTLKNPLKDRINIVVSSIEKTSFINNVIFVPSIEEAIEISLKKFFSKEINKIFMIGLYDYILNSVLLDKFYVTKIRRNYECDKFIDKNLLFEKCNKIDENDLICSDNINIEFSIFQNKKQYSGEKQYLNLMLETLLFGEYRSTRNANTWSLFSSQIKFDLSNEFPLTTTRKSFLKNIFYELRMFLLGKSDTKEYLEKNDVKIWKLNTSREFLDSVGLNDYEEGNIGYLYGAVWRHFNGQLDQLDNVINLLKTDPNSRRILMTSYDPANVHLAPLYPCHSLILQFYVSDTNKLNIHMYQRSADLFLGLNTNIPSTALLCHIICKLCGNLIPGIITISIGDYHIYESHLDSVIKQLSRNCYSYPTLRIDNFQSVEELKLEDVILENYQHHPSIKTEMVA